MPNGHGVGAHHLSRQLLALGYDVKLLPAQFVKPFLKGQKNDFRDVEAVAEAVQRPAMRLCPPRVSISSIFRRCIGCARGGSASAPLSSIRSGPFCSSAASPSARA